MGQYVIIIDLFSMELYTCKVINQIPNGVYVYHISFLT